MGNSDDEVRKFSFLLPFLFHAIFVRCLGSFDDNFHKVYQFDGMVDYTEDFHRTISWDNAFIHEDKIIYLDSVINEDNIIEWVGVLINEDMVICSVLISEDKLAHL